MRGQAARLIGGSFALLVGACSLTSLDDLQGGGSGGGSSSTAGATTPDAAETTATAPSSSATSDGGGTSSAEGGGGHGGGSGGRGPAPPDLVDTGLLVRYFLDEADGGTAQAVVTDAKEPALDLSIDYAEGMSFVEEDGHRGLSWSVVEAGGIADSPIADTKILALDQSLYGTLEAVIQIEEATSAGSRILHVGSGSDSSFTLAVSVAEGDPALPTDLELRTRSRVTEEYLFSYFSADFAAQERTVVHAVYDTREPLEADRMRMYQDGKRLEAIMLNPAPQQNEPLFVAPGELLCLGNRLSGDRSIRGTIFYAAAYLAALSDDDIAHNAAELRARDDR